MVAQGQSAQRHQTAVERLDADRLIRCRASGWSVAVVEAPAVGGRGCGSGTVSWPSNIATSTAPPRSPRRVSPDERLGRSSGLSTSSGRPSSGSRMSSTWSRQLGSRGSARGQHERRVVGVFRQLLPVPVHLAPCLLSVCRDDVRALVRGDLCDGIRHQIALLPSRTIPAARTFFTQSDSPRVDTMNSDPLCCNGMTGVCSRTRH